MTNEYEQSDGRMQACRSTSSQKASGSTPTIESPGSVPGADAPPTRPAQAAGSPATGVTPRLTPTPALTESRPPDEIDQTEYGVRFLVPHKNAGQAVCQPSVYYAAQLAVHAPGLSEVVQRRISAWEPALPPAEEQA